MIFNVLLVLVPAMMLIAIATWSYVLRSRVSRASEQPYFGANDLSPQSLQFQTTVLAYLTQIDRRLSAVEGQGPLVGSIVITALKNGTAGSLSMGIQHDDLDKVVDMTEAVQRMFQGVRP